METYMETQNGGALFVYVDLYSLAARLAMAPSSHLWGNVDLHLKHIATSL